MSYMSRSGLSHELSLKVLRFHKHHQYSCIAFRFINIYKLVDILFITFLLFSNAASLLII